jgi:formylglycine-generating enzyme required for sulfatase activity
VALDKEEVAEALSQVGREARVQSGQGVPPGEVSLPKPALEPAAPPPRTQAQPDNRQLYLLLAVVGGGLLLLVLIAVAGAFFVASDSSESTAAVSKTAQKKAAPSKQQSSAGYYLVSPGKFKMGSPASEDGHERDEALHTVEITRPFLIGLTEVTQAEYSDLMGTNPSEHTGCSRCPVERVTWMDAVRYCNALSSLNGLMPAYRIRGQTADSVAWDRGANGYRLPTEAEWEYAARAGESGRFTGGSQAREVAWHRDNAISTREVRQLGPNSWGMYDVSGNVVEWVWDWYDKKAYSKPSHSKDPRGPSAGDRKAARGGSWRRSAFGVRLANRSKAPPDERNNGLGFRVVRNGR